MQDGRHFEREIGGLILRKKNIYLSYKSIFTSPKQEDIIENHTSIALLNIELNIGVCNELVTY